MSGFLGFLMFLFFLRGILFILSLFVFFFGVFCSPGFSKDFRGLFLFVVFWDCSRVSRDVLVFFVVPDVPKIPQFLRTFLVLVWMDGALGIFFSFTVYVHFVLVGFFLGLLDFSWVF